MARCPDPGRLRAYLDGEVTPAERMALGGHLDHCEACRATLATLRHTADVVRQRMRALTPADEALLTGTAWRRLRPRLRHAPVAHTWRERIPTMTRRLQGPGRLALSGGLASLVVLLALALTPAGSLAVQAISIFRVQTFKAITIEVDPATMPDMAGHRDQAPAPDGEKPTREEVERELAELGVTLDTTFDEGPAREVADIDAARVAAGGGAVRQVTDLPAALRGSAPEVLVVDPTTSTVSVDLATFRQALKDQGHEAPETLPGVSPTATAITATLKTSFSVVQAHGEGDARLVFAQGASPELTFSEGIDVLAIRDAALAMPGISKTTRTQILSIRDDEWGKTLFIPAPPGTVVKDVTVGGVLGTGVGGAPGLLLLDPQGQGGVVLWQTDGTLYAIAGAYGEEALLRAANSVR